MNIRSFKEQDFTAVWEIIHEVVILQDTYAFNPDMEQQEAYTIWIKQALRTYVVEESGEIVATYYLKQNFDGPGSHVCNCGYMVASQWRGQGIASLMCQHSQQQAIQLGFKAMQFNSVVSTNKVAVKIWENHGFSIVGTLPKAYQHKDFGFVDAYIMYKWLA